MQADLNGDLSIGSGELDHIDRLAFSEAVREFQQQQGLTPPDAKLGPVTLRRLRECYGLTPERPDVLKILGGLVFRPATVPVSAPPGPPLKGRTPAENSVCGLWNRYGAAIYRQAQTFRLPVVAALAVFTVESKTAYD
ncbi:MAG TPA: peptidoglycan-binding domain-containing protein, partial [Desulfobaccales bacterium]|nr:peptidoglycan-binding domain-containing protein [Desulfobaccales bacterium]